MRAEHTLPAHPDTPRSQNTHRRHDFSWIEAPVAGPDGWPNEYRGVVDEVPGLFFCGLSFQWAFSSMVLPGVARDTAHVAEKIDRRATDRARVPA